MLETGWELQHEGVSVERMVRRASGTSEKAPSGAKPGTGATSAGLAGFHDFTNITLIRSDAELHPYGAAPEGEIQLSGRRVSAPGPDRALVFQDFALLPWRTVLKNVELGLELKGDPPRKREEVARILTGAGFRPVFAGG